MKKIDDFQTQIQSDEVASREGMDLIDDFEHDDDDD